MGGHPSWIPRIPGMKRPEGAEGGQPHAVFHGAYESGEAPWDIGQAQPEMVALDEAGVLGPRVLDVGCGTGEMALYLASHGHDVTGIDAVPLAIEAAQERATARGLDVCFRAADVLAVLPELIGKFHSVVDVGFFHALSDDQRAEFATKLADRIAPGGVYAMMCFSDRVPGAWGPRRVSEAEIRATFAGPEWRIRDVRDADLLSAVAEMPNVDANLAVIERV
jgi:cyclopropane fatty-acyl-phospholipid synthase-like methyltransferase